MLLALNSISHFLVDALCVSTVFGIAAAGRDLAMYLIVYNSLAFSTQCVIGLLTDMLRRHGLTAAAGVLFVILGFILPLPHMARVVLVGIGNSIFHVAGGSMCLEESGGKARRLGVFVAPGAFGVCLGTLYTQTAPVYALALLVCAAFYIYISLRRADLLTQKSSGGEEQKYPVLAIALLVCAVAVRAVGGSAVSFPWKSGAFLSILMTAFVFAGKMCGGFVCDKFGAKTMAWLSIPLSAVLIAFFSPWALPSLAGQFLLNLSMPVTLYLMYRAMPDSPGFAFGMAASALWPGTVIGELFTLTGPALWICILVCFVFGLAAIIYADKK